MWRTVHTHKGSVDFADNYSWQFLQSNDVQAHEAYQASLLNVECWMLQEAIEIDHVCIIQPQHVEAEWDVYQAYI